MRKVDQRKRAALDWARTASRNPDLTPRQARAFATEHWPELAPAFEGKPCLGTVLLELDEMRPEFDREDPARPSEWQAKPRRRRPKTARLKASPHAQRERGKGSKTGDNAAAPKRRSSPAPRSGNRARNPVIAELNPGDERHKVSAKAGSRWIFEPVTTPNIATVGGSEKHLEDWLMDNWEQLDLGSIGRLRLVHRQVRPSTDGSERVDLVAWRERDKRWFLLELKAKTCSPGDLTQLAAYRNAACRALDVPLDRIHGILIAPEFHKKVREAAGANAEIHLLRYARKPRRA